MKRMQMNKKDSQKDWKTNALKTSFLLRIIHKQKTIKSSLSNNPLGKYNVRTSSKTRDLSSTANAYLIPKLPQMHSRENTGELKKSSKPNSTRFSRTSREKSKD